MHSIPQRKTMRTGTARRVPFLAAVAILSVAGAWGEPSPAPVADLFLQQQLGIGEDPLPQIRSQLASLEKAGPLSFNDQKTQAHLWLAEGKTEKALAALQQLNRRAPDDLDTYALLVQAHRKLGQGKEAITQAQWILNLRPTDTRGLLAAAELRVDNGDTFGALDLFAEAYRRYQLHESLSRAYVLVRLAELQITTQPKAARKMAEEANRMAPGSKRISKLIESLP